MATLQPLVWAARRLAPGSAEIESLVPAGAGCEGVEFTPKQIRTLHQADLVLMVGAGLESQVERMPTPAWQQRILLAASLPEGVSLIDHEHTHDRDHGHDHAHGADPHMWLDPAVMASFVEAVADRMKELWPGDAPRIAEAAAQARREIEEIDAAYREMLGRAESKTLVTHHNAWAYLARRYGLQVAAVVQPSHGIEPTPGDITAAAGALREAGVNTIFIEPQLGRRAVDRLAMLTGAEVMTLDPLGDGDWPAMMRKNLEALSDGLGSVNGE